MVRRQSLAGELRAGIFTAINLSPIDVGYGLLMVSALGLAYAGQGVAAAFLAVVIGNLVPAILGRSGMLFSGARPAQTLLVTELIAQLLHNGHIPSTFAGIFPYVAACTLLAGLLQLSFGLLRAGRMIKYFPVPVLTGYINAVALLIVWPASIMILGFPRGSSLLDVLQGVSLKTFYLAAFGLALLLAMAWVLNHYKKVHWSIAGLFGGTALYYVMREITGLSLGGHLPVVASIAPPWQSLAELLTGALPAPVPDMIRTVLPYSLAISVLNAMESLLAAAKLEELSGQRIDANRVLVNHGIANMLGGLLGALPMAPSISRVNIGWELGGRGPLALGIGAGTGILMMFLGNYVIGWVPVSVVGCLMAFLAWTMLDNWTHGQIRKIFSPALEPTLRRQVRTNMMIMVSVVVVAFTGHLIAAMITGIVIAMFIFVRDYGRSVIGRSFSGTHRHSVVMRQENDMDYLEKHGDCILIQELNAPIVFGTADRLLDHVQRLPPTIRFLIFDCQRVREIDDKGSRILVRLAGLLAKRGVEFHLSHIRCDGPRGSILMDAGLGKILPADHWHRETDSALEAVENRLLQEVHFPEPREMDLRDLDIARDLDDTEITILLEHLKADCYGTGEKVFSRGDAGDRLYIVAIGHVEIRLPLDNKGLVTRRIAAFRPGIVFGEMAMLNGSKRSADAVAGAGTAVWSLSRTALDRLQERRPMLVSKLMFNIARQLSSRLGVTNDELIYATRS